MRLSSIYLEDQHGLPFCSLDSQRMLQVARLRTVTFVHNMAADVRVHVVRRGVVDDTLLPISLVSHC